MPQEIPAQQAIAEALLDFLRATILAEGVAVDETTALSQLGVDSVSLVELLLFIERRFDVVVPERELTATNLATIAALSACVQRNAAGDAANSAKGDEPKEP
jgi:acyl carrier protein